MLENYGKGFVSLLFDYIIEKEKAICLYKKDKICVQVNIYTFIQFDHRLGINFKIVLVFSYNRNMITEMNDFYNHIVCY